MIGITTFGAGKALCMRCPVIVQCLGSSCHVGVRFRFDRNVFYRDVLWCWYRALCSVFKELSMLLKVYCVRDVQADRGILPIYRERVELAIRDFTTSILNPQHPFSQNPDDYVLYFVGTWDDETMHFVNEDNIRVIDGMTAHRQGLERLRKIESLKEAVEVLENGKDIGEGLQPSEDMPAV